MVESRALLFSKIDSIVLASQPPLRLSIENLDERGPTMQIPTLNLSWNEEGQDIAEYAVMLAVILIIVFGAIRLIGSNANTVFSQVASAIQ